ncbi:MAG: hypothetical protein E6H68_17435 [Betaproteobacteria bacterium]|nr:MAG: hypothetical protein E6H68_17435 [Betaproteobacteria bacterium]
MKSLLTFTNVLLPLILGGCAMGWSRPNTTEAEFKLDRFECEQQAAGRYPVVIASIGSGHEAPSQANCSSYAGHMNCTATPGSYVPPRQVDANANDRAKELSYFETLSGAGKIGMIRERLSRLAAIEKTVTLRHCHKAGL